MTKPKKLRDSRIESEADERLIVPETPVVVETLAEVEGETTIIAEIATPKRYVPPNCSCCTALRPKPDISYVSVYHTRREDGYILHYCKCGFCNNTFKHSEKF